MKACPRIRRFILITGMLGLGIPGAPGSTVVVSNRVAGNAPQTAQLLDTRGQPIPAGAWMQVGTFGGRSAAEITALCAGGASEVVAALSPFGDASSVGTGSGGSAGNIEFAASAPLANSLSNVYAVVLNAAIITDAAEMLVLKLADGLPADDPSGLEGYLAVHLRDAVPVFGTTAPNGLTTATWLTGFEGWIAGRLPSGTPSGRRLENSDPDGDGLPNLVEYALGSDAGDGASRSSVELSNANGVPVLRSLRCSSDSRLGFVVETSATLAADSWTPVPPSATEVADPPTSPPAGYRWMEQALPTGTGRLFVRLRVTLSEAP